MEQRRSLEKLARNLQTKVMETCHARDSPGVLGWDAYPHFLQRPSRPFPWLVDFCRSAAKTLKPLKPRMTPA